MTSGSDWQLDKLRFTADHTDEAELAEIDAALSDNWEVFAALGDPTGERVLYIRRRVNDNPTHFN